MRRSRSHEGHPAGSPCRSSGGFTLFEVLAALAVLAVGFAAMIRGSGVQAKNAIYLRDRTLAHWVAMNQVAERQIRRDWSDPDLFKGEEEMAGRTWHWTVVVSSTPESTMRRLDVEVRAERDDPTPLSRLEAYLAQP
ncbi:MAG: type II secretion system minor pseudopilin GspI [Magnetococcales bacterium]|nr:type II secretion system minor pseudopilin GspI [Magnetococcales bacterium]